MDISSRCMCQTIFNNIINLPVAHVILPKMDEYSLLTKSKLTVKIIQDKLESDKYENIDACIKDITTLFNELIKVSGPTTPFGLSCQTLLQELQESLNNSIPKTVYKTPNSISLDRLITHTKELVELIPNSSEKVAPKIDPDDDVVFTFENETIERPKFNEEDFKDIIYQLHNIQSDELMQKVYNCIRTSEYIPASNSSTFTLDITTLSPFAMDNIRRLLLSENLL